MLNFADLLIAIIIAVAAYFGSRRGAVKQLFSLGGVILGIFVAAFIYDKLAFLTENSLLKVVVMVIILAGATFLAYDIFTTLGGRLQQLQLLQRFRKSRWNKPAVIIVTVFGSLTMIWLGSIIFGPIAPQIVRTQIDGSRILGTISQTIPKPTLVANASQLLSPFSSPDVFVGQEPSLSNTTVSQEFENLDAAIATARPSIVKINSWGCGSTASGSGFIIDNRRVVTNAHVVAGSDRIVIDANGQNFVGQVILFDSNTDMAVLLTENNLPGSSLEVTDQVMQPGSISAVMGYPGGGSFTAGDAIIMQTLTAEGYDIYNKNKVIRQVYALRGDVVPGNSGGPVLNSAGHVAGLIIGHSDSQNRTGYALTAAQIYEPIKTAHNLDTVIDSGSCAAN